MSSSSSANVLEQLGDPLRFGHEVRFLADLGEGSIGVAGVELAHDVLRVQDADDVDVRGVVYRDARVAVLDEDAHRLGERRHQRDGHDVGPGRHHFADDGVAELEDGVDEPLLVFFDGRLLRCLVGHRPDLRLRDEGPFLESPAGQDDIGDTDEETGSGLGTEGTCGRVWRRGSRIGWSPSCTRRETLLSTIILLSTLLGD
jgi:hypothetical protein